MQVVIQMTRYDTETINRGEGANIRGSLSEFGQIIIIAFIQMVLLINKHLIQVREILLFEDRPNQIIASHFNHKDF